MYLEKQANYVPAIGEQFIEYWRKGLTYKGHDLKFFTDKSFFQYKYLLATAYYRINQKDDNRKSICVRDSSGNPFLICLFWRIKKRLQRKARLASRRGTPSKKVGSTKILFE